MFTRLSTCYDEARREIVTWRGPSAMQTTSNAVRLLLVTRDPEVEEQVLRACREVENLTLVGTIARVDEAASVARQRHARAILLDHSVLENLEQVLLDVSLAAPECFVFTLVPRDDLDLAQRSLLAGARGFIFKPIDPEDLSRTVVRVITLDTLRHSEAEKDGRRETGLVLTIVGAKGGIGRTVIAANLAVALHRQSEAPVLVVEAMTLPGDLAAMFAIAPQISLLDILAAGSDIDITSLEEMIPKHASGVHVLPGAIDYDSGAVDANRLRGFLRLAHQMFRYIVIDTGELQDPLTEVAIEEADRLLLVTSPDLLALHRTVKFYNALTEGLDLPEDAITLVFNGNGMRGGVRKSAVEQVLGTAVHHSITYDPDTVMESIRKGMPFMASNTRSQVAQDVQRLAQTFIAQDGSPFGGLKGPATAGLLDRVRSLLTTAIQPATSHAKA